MNITGIAYTLAHSIATGGATVSTHGNRANAGLVVALYQDAEHKLEYKSKFYAQTEIESWLWLQDKDGLVPSWAHVGLWVDDQGDIYLDIVEVIQASKLARAVRHAQDRNQRAIFFLDTQTVLWLTEPVGA